MELLQVGVGCLETLPRKIGAKCGCWYWAIARASECLSVDSPRSLSNELTRSLKEFWLASEVQLKRQKQDWFLGRTHQIRKLLVCCAWVALYQQPLQAKTGKLTSHF